MRSTFPTKSFYYRNGIGDDNFEQHRSVVKKLHAHFVTSVLKEKDISYSRKKRTK